MANKMSVTVKSGKFKNADDLKASLARRFYPYLMKAREAMQHAMQQTTPVVSGKLRASVTVSRPEWDGNIRLVKVGPHTVYARRVNLTSRRNKGYIKRGEQRGRPAANGHLREGMKAIQPKDVYDKK